MTVQTPGPQAPPLLERLRAELAEQTDKSLQALLLHECGTLSEQAGDEPGAARDYLAAFSADPHFREPLEALVRILTRRKSVKNLGKLLEALVRAAASLEERVRSFWERAAFLQDYEQNLPAARESLEEAIATNPEDATCWLELEILAGKEGDVEVRLRALEARAELASDAVWKALLFIDLALLTAKSGNSSRAYELLDAASALEGKVRFRTQAALETVARAEDNTEVLARSLESQADLIAEGLEEPERADENGVPRWLRSPENVADLWYRAAELRRRVGDEAGWAALVQRAADTLPASPALARAKIAALEVSGDLEGAAKAARQEIDRGAEGAGAAALWLRVAEASAVASDRAAALEALQKALVADAGSVPARALQIDLLGDGEDPKALAKSYEELAAAYTAHSAQAGALVVAAYLHTCESADVPAAQVALGKAVELGFSRTVAARCARVFAALAGDAGWYESSTRELLEVETGTAERVGLLLELGRSRLLHADLDGARAAFDVLAKEEGGAWLGRVLAAYGPELAQATEAVEEGASEEPIQRSAETLEALARVESDPALSRGLLTVAAFRAARAGQPDRALALLRELFDSSAGDEVATLFLASLQHARGDGAAAGAALTACAAASEEPEVAAALHLEAALLLYRSGDKAKAIDAFEAARVGAPRAAATLLSWALRATGKDLASRRRALEAAAEAGEDATFVALERFALEVAGGGDADEALVALEAVEGGALGDVLVAGGLARLIWPRAAQDVEAVEAVLSRLAMLGGQGAAVAASERFYRAAASGVDRTESLTNAAARAEVVPALAPAIEWLGAAIGAEDRSAESAARRLLGSHLEGEVASAIEASAELVDFLESPVTPRDLLHGEGWAAHLLNLELAPPGCDPRRRSAALRTFASGDHPDLEALVLAGWADLAAGDAEAAQGAFSTVTEARADDVAAWEGMRAAANMLGDHVGAAVASAQLGSLCKDDRRGAAFWEQAGLLLLEHTEAHDDAEIAFERAFGRDPTRAVAFDKLFRRVRGRNEDDKLLEIVGRRLEVVDDETELCKLYWERARVLRKKGDFDGAIEALENVVLLEKDHVGAIALTAEIHIIRKRFDEAAPSLARLAGLPSAPQQQRLVSGVAAADLYENKLGKTKEALEVLRVLHDGGLSTPPVRERLARIAAKAGAWADATRVLEQLMDERDKKEGRVEAARLAMAIHRDELREPLQAEAAVAKLLEEAPDDAEGVELVLTTGFDGAFRAKQLGRAKQALVLQLGQNPLDADRVALLAKIAGAGGDTALRQATLGALVTLGRGEGALSEELARIDRTVPSRPQIVLDGATMAQVADPEDNGPVAELFAQMAEIVSLALGPSLATLGVGKKERVDSRGGQPLRVAIAEWMGALAFETDFELYVGGSGGPKKVTGVAGELPALVVGPGVQVPLDVESRSAIAREAFALRRGITAVRSRDDATIASLVTAACQDAGVALPNPSYAVFGEVSRGVKKEMTRKVRNSIRELAAAIGAQQPDARAWAAAARRSLDRMAVIAAGDVSVVVSEILGAPRDELAGRIEGDDRLRDLLCFVLSPNYLEIRRKLGMGVR